MKSIPVEKKIGRENSSRHLMDPASCPGDSAIAEAGLRPSAEQEAERTRREAGEGQSLEVSKSEQMAETPKIIEGNQSLVPGGTSLGRIKVLVTCQDPEDCA
ncbi:uncharacterized protein ACIGJ3_008838 isoform 1-T1 [Trichechus inunguis]